MTGEGTLAIRCSRRTVASTVAIRILIEGGQLLERRPGLGWVTGRMLVEGTRCRDWGQIASEAEALGMDIVPFAGPEVIGLAVDALAPDWRQALEWAAEATLESTFPAERCAWIARQTAGELESLAEQPDVVGGWAFLDQLYSPHPWGRPLQGSAASLAGLTSDDVGAFHEESVSRRLIVSIAGELDPDEAAAEAERLFGRRPTVASVAPSVPQPATGVDPIRRVEVPKGEQAHLYLGQLTVPLTHPDRVALELAAVALGAGPGLAGRIPERIRETEGLAYVTQVATVAGAGSVPGRMVVYLATAVDNIDRAHRVVVEELERFAADGVTEHELEMACRYLLGSAPFRRETAGQVAVLQAQACRYDVPFDRESWLADRLREVDQGRLNQVIRCHLDPTRLVTTIGVPRARDRP